MTLQGILAAITGVLCIGILPTMYTLLLSAALIWSYLRLAKVQGGINGDFLGATIIGGELAAMLACLI